MPIYRFVCKNDHEMEDLIPLSQYKEGMWRKCKQCGKRANLAIPTRFHANVFNPYVEENITGKPIEITSRAQRDKLLADNHLTYDSNDYGTKRPTGSAVDGLDYQEVKEAMQKGKDNEGNAVVGTVDGEEALD